MRKLFLITLILFAQNVFAGGMDAGGGGTLPTHPVPIYKVKEIVSEAKPKLLYLFNDYEAHLKYGLRNSLLSKLFLGARKVQDVLNDLRVEVREDRPCLTAQGSEVDGSIYGIKANTICISALRISQKVDLGVAEREILALLAHEVSHFMGTNEAEAEELQKDIADRILHSSNGIELDLEKIRFDMVNGLNFLRRTIEATQKNQFEQAMDWSSRSLSAFIQVRVSPQAGGYRLFSPREEDYRDLLYYKLLWADQYIGTLIEGAGQPQFQKRYNERFGSQDYFFLADELGDRDHLYGHEKIYKIKSLTDLISLLKVLEREYEVRTAYIWQSTFGSNWVNIDGHLTKTFANPWRSFVGVYTVQSNQCSATSDFDREIKEIRIYQFGDDLFLQTKYLNGHANDRIELGAYHVNTYLNDYGLMAPNKVYMTHAMGGSWSDRFYLGRSIVGFTLETFPNQSFKISIDKIFEDRNIMTPDRRTTCVLSGTFQK